MGAVERIIPPIDIGPERLWEEYTELYQGIRSERDPVSWLTTLSDIKKFLGVKNPDRERVPNEKIGEALIILSSLVDGTYLEPLKPELMYGLGFSEGEIEENLEWNEELDVLLINGRHYPEALLWRTADELLLQGKRVAVINPIGHYDDTETRVIGIRKLFHQVDKVIILASTHEKFGGSVSVLATASRILRNPEFSVAKVGEAIIVIPMLGSSRSDKDGQSPEMGYEVHQAISDSKLFALVVNDIREGLGREIGSENVPLVRFVSVDIHSDAPSRVFLENGLNFDSICPAEEFALAFIEELRERDKYGWNGNEKLCGLPLKIIVFDNGAVPRSQKFAMTLVSNPEFCYPELDVVYVTKIRQEAGKVKEASVGRVERWTRGEDGKVLIKKLTAKEIPSSINPSPEECVTAGFDDILASGGTAEINDQVVRLLFPNTVFKVDAFTHIIATKGVPYALDKTGANVVFVGNTLRPLGLNDDPRAREEDLASAVVRGIYES